MKPAAGLTDGVVRLRAPLEQDATAITEACQDGEIQRWNALPIPYTKEDALKWMALVETDRRAGSALHQVIVDVEDGRLLGAVGVDFRRNTSGQAFAKAGYWVAPGERRRGVATRALILLSDWALSRSDIEWVELNIEPANEPSRTVALRAGFELDRRGSETEGLGGRLVELDRYRREAKPD